VSDVHAHVHALYYAIGEQTGRAPNRLCCAPVQAENMRVLVQELGLPLLVQPDEECDENLIYLMHAEQPE
jgi:hypothetical protein